MKKILILSALLVVGAGGVIGFSLMNNDKPPVQVSNEKTASDLEQGLSVRYKEPLTEQALSGQDKDDKFIIRLTSQAPAMIVSVRYEEGLRAASAVTKQETLPMLLGNADKAFPQRYTEYSKKGERQFEIAGKKAAELIFTYKGPNGDVAKQRLLIIAKDENTAIYIAFQAQETGFEGLNTEYFEPMVQTISFD